MQLPKGQDFSPPKQTAVWGGEGEEEKRSWHDFRCSISSMFHLASVAPGQITHYHLCELEHPPPHFSPGRVLHQDCRSQCACAFASPRTALKLKRLPHYTAPFSPLTCCKGQFPQNWLWVWTLWPLPCRESHARAVTQPALLFWPRIAPSPAEPHLINLKRNNHPP